MASASWHGRCAGCTSKHWGLQALKGAQGNHLMLLCVLLGAVSLLLMLLHLHITSWGSHDLSPDITLSLGRRTSLLASQSLHHGNQKVGAGLCRCADSGTDLCLEACPHPSSRLVHSAEIAQWQRLGPPRDALKLHAQSRP